MLSSALGNSICQLLQTLHTSPKYIDPRGAPRVHLHAPLVVVLVSLTQHKLVTVLLPVSARHKGYKGTVSTARNRESVNRRFFACGRESVKGRDIILTSRNKINMATFCFHFGAQQVEELDTLIFLFFIH